MCDFSLSLHWNLCPRLGGVAEAHGACLSSQLSEECWPGTEVPCIVSADTCGYAKSQPLVQVPFVPHSQSLLAASKAPTLLWNHYVGQGGMSVWPLLIHGRVANYNGRVTHSQKSGLPLRHFWSSGQQWPPPSYLDAAPVDSFPRSWPQIQCCHVVWSEWGPECSLGSNWGSLAASGAGLSPPVLGPILCTPLLMHGAWALHSPSPSPSYPQSS